MAGFRVEGNTSGNVAEVDVNNNLKTVMPVAANNGGIRTFFENDSGGATGVPYLMSPEVDDDYRLRVGHDIFLDEEDMTYSTQNFTKHAMYATSFVPNWTTTGFNTNPTALTTASAALVFKTYKTFALQGTETLSFDIEGAFSAAMVANQTIEFGGGLTANTTPYDCFDGAYIRASATGIFGVLRNNAATDTFVTNAFNSSTGTLWIPVPGRKYQFIIYIAPRSCKFWISDPVGEAVWLACDAPTPPGFGAPIASSSTPFFCRQVYGSTAPTTAVSFALSRYNVRRGGAVVASSLSEIGTRSLESSMSQGTLATTFNQVVTTGSIVKTTAAAPTNTTSLLASLGGFVNEIGTLAIGTDGILMSYQNPALPVAVGTTYNNNKRLKIDGITIASGVSTAFTAGGFIKYFYIAYGSTALSLQGVAADTVTTKAYRRVMLPITQLYTATHAIAATAQQSSTYFKFEYPIYVNPGEFVALVTTHMGTAGVTGVITHAIQFDYAWE